MFFAGSGKNEAALLIIYRSQHNNPLVFNLDLLQYKGKHSIKGIPFNLGTVEVPKLSFVKKSFSI